MTDDMKHCCFSRWLWKYVEKDVYISNRQIERCSHFLTTPDLEELWAWAVSDKSNKCVFVEMCFSIVRRTIVRQRSESNMWPILTSGHICWTRKIAVYNIVFCIMENFPCDRSPHLIESSRKFAEQQPGLQKSYNCHTGYIRRAPVCKRKNMTSAGALSSNSAINGWQMLHFKLIDAPHLIRTNT